MKFVYVWTQQLMLVALNFALRALEDVWRFVMLRMTTDDVEFDVWTMSIFFLAVRTQEAIIWIVSCDVVFQTLGHLEVGFLANWTSVQFNFVWLAILLEFSTKPSALFWWLQVIFLVGEHVKSHCVAWK